MRYRLPRFSFSIAERKMSSRLHRSIVPAATRQEHRMFYRSSQWSVASFARLGADARRRRQDTAAEIAHTPAACPGSSAGVTRGCTLAPLDRSASDLVFKSGAL